MISDLKRENQFLGVYMSDLYREICKPALKLYFMAHDIMEFLSEFRLR
jgi:hypothetical protein